MSDVCIDNMDVIGLLIINNWKSMKKIVSILYLSVVDAKLEYFQKINNSISNNVKNNNLNANNVIIKEK